MKLRLNKFQGLFMIFGALIGIITDGLITIILGAVAGLLLGALVNE